MRGLARRTGIAVLLALSAGRSASASTLQTVLGRKIQVKNPSPTDPSRRKLVIQGFERQSAATVNGDPRTDGALLRVILNGSTDQDVLYTLAKEGWSRAGSQGFKYSNRIPGGPVKRASLTKSPRGTFQLKISADGRHGMLSLVPPNPGDGGGIVLTITPNGNYSASDNYCVAFGGPAGGVEVRDDGQVWWVKNAAFGACPVTSVTTTTQPGGSTTSTTTTTIAGSTTTLAPCTTTTGPSTTTTTVPPIAPCEFGSTTGCDTFYLPPDPIPNVAPGTVIDSRSVSIGAPSVSTPFQAWQLKYVSTDAHDRPSVVVATLIMPLTCPLSGPRPLVSYQTAEDSLSMLCSPSYRMRAGTEKEEASLPPLLAQGWAVVVPDYEGLESQYTAGLQAGHGVLDGIRAAIGFAPAGLAGNATPVGMWGYSGGGLATAWATELAPTYAPELNIVGVAAGGVPPDITAVAKNLDGGPLSAIELAGTVGMSRAYPEIQTLFNAAGQAMAADIGTQCIEQYAASTYAFRSMDEFSTVPNAICLPSIQAIMAQNHLGSRIPTAPMYVFHAVNDELIPMADVNDLIALYCDEGVTVQYYQDLANDHVSLAVSGAPAAVAYLGQRFAGTPPLNTCAVPVIPALMQSTHCQ